jgi:hypothetical protein
MFGDQTSSQMTDEDFATEEAVVGEFKDGMRSFMSFVDGTEEMDLGSHVPVVKSGGVSSAF